MDLGDTYNLSIGQGYVLVTPLQLAVSFMPIANGGTLYQPRMVKAIVDKNREIVEEFKPEIKGEVEIDKNYLEVVREGMRDAVRYGSSVFLSDLPVKTAAKTGTAQISGTKDLFHNWVVVFAPYDKPQIVLTVLVEEVPGIQAAALPVAKEILNWYFNHLTETKD